MLRNRMNWNIISIHAPPRGATRCMCYDTGEKHFNSRPSARGDDAMLKRHAVAVEISIHAPPRGATGAPNVRPDLLRISIHAPPRGATSAFRHDDWSERFQFTPLREGRLKEVHAGTKHERFQFTPLREGRRVCPGHNMSIAHFNSRPSARGDYTLGGDTDVYQNISIHPPPRGATRFCETRNEAKRSISIHAPPRGATICMGVCGASTLFQFTPLREGRPVTQSTTSRRSVFQFTPLREGRRQLHGCGQSPRISIHAPPRGATSPPTSTPITTAYFNSRPSARGDQVETEKKTATLTFQFTPLREGRREWRDSNAAGNDFNSRPSARGDVMHKQCAVCGRNFNSRPSARGDARSPGKTRRAPLFQFTPLREGRPTWTAVGTLLRSFQFTPLREGRPARSVAHACGFFYFNSRPSARGDILQRFHMVRIANFNSRPSARGDTSRTCGILA